MTYDDKALVERLSAEADEWDEPKSHDEFDMRGMLYRAADRIEALSAENERLREELSQLTITKPDPLEKLLQSIAITLDANDLREALDEAGLEVREKGK